MKNIHIIPGDKSSTLLQKGGYQTIAGALLKTPEWKAWMKYASENNLFDVYETHGCDMMSDKHMRAFIDFVTKK